MLPKQLTTLIRDIRFAMLTTCSPDGSLHCRPMVTQAEEADSHLWFYTGKQTHKAIEIEDHPLVNVSYSDAVGQRYVSVSGRAKIIDDTEVLQKRWRPALAAWIPKGRDDPDLALLQVTIDHIEYWASPTSWIGHTIPSHGVMDGTDQDAGKGDS